MKNTIILPLSIFFLFFGASYHASAQDAATRKDYSTCFKVADSSDYFFGRIHQYELAEHTFRLVNKCKDTIRIGNVKSGCGCTAAMLPDSVVVPGGEAKVAVRFQPSRGSAGKIGKPVSVYLWGEAQTIAVLRIFADIFSDISLNPETLELPQIQPGNEIERKFKVSNKGKDSLDIIDTQCILYLTRDEGTFAAGNTDAEIHDVKVEPAKFKLAPGASKTVSIRFATIRPGTVNGTVVIQTERESAQLQVKTIVPAKGK
jgi:hypothetical protein